MGPAIRRVYTISKRIDKFIKTVVVLNCCFDYSAVDVFLYIYWFGVDNFTVLVKIFYETSDSSIEIISYLVVRPTIFVKITLEVNLQPLVKICHFFESLG